MTAPADQKIVMPISELRLLLRDAACEGASYALRQLGLHDEFAAEDMRDLRTLIEAWRSIKHTMLKTAASLIAKTLLAGLFIGAIFFFKAKLPFGN